MHATTRGREHSATRQRFGIGIALVLAQFLQTQLLVLFTPTVQVGLADSAPPHLIKVANLPSIALRQRDQGVAPLFFPGVFRVWAGDPVFRSLLPDPKLFEGESDGFETHLAPRQTLLNTDLCGQFQRPTTRRFAEHSWTLVQQGPQRFTPGLVKQRLYRFWPGRFLFEALQALLLKSMDRIAYGLRCTA